MAVTVPAWLPGRVCWRLSDEYHAPYVPGGHVRIYRAGQLRDKLRAAGIEPASSHHAHALHSPYWWLRCAIGPANDDNRAVAEAMAPVLAARGLLLVGLDMIGNRVTEINVTSPTCFQEIQQQTGFDVPAMFVDALEAALR